MGDEGGFGLGSGQQGIRQLQVMEEATVDGGAGLAIMGRGLVVNEAG